MHDTTLLKISICTCTIGLILLFILLHTRYHELETNNNAQHSEIFSIKGEIKSMKTYESFTSINVEHIVTDKLIAFKNISTSDTCFNGIIQKDGENMIIKKMKKCP